MDKQEEWSLSPAFDVIYSYNPSGDWTSKHQMSLNGKRDGFTVDDFKAVAETASMRRGGTEVIVEEVTDAVKLWPEFALQAGVSHDQIEQIAAVHR